MSLFSFSSFFLVAGVDEILRRFIFAICSSSLHFVQWRRKDRCRVVVVVCDVTVLVSSLLYKYVNQARRAEEKTRKRENATSKGRFIPEIGKSERWIHQMMPFLAMMTNEDEGEVFLSFSFSFSFSLSLFSSMTNEKDASFHHTFSFSSLLTARFKLFEN